LLHHNTYPITEILKPENKSSTSDPVGGLTGITGNINGKTERGSAKKIMYFHKSDGLAERRGEFNAPTENKFPKNI